MRPTLLPRPLLAACAALLLTGCNGSASPPSPGERVASTLERDRSPDVPAADREALVAGNTAFALDLYQATRGTPGNRFASPFSVSLALAMTWAGARGDTEAQMADALHFDLTQAQLHPAFNWLDLELASRSQEQPQTGDPGFRLSLTNQLFGQTGYAFRPEFLDTLALHYGAAMQLMDFGTRPEQCRADINAWVAERTADRIEELLPQGSLTPDTRLVLVNAVYFKAAWAEPFDEAETSPDAFHLPGGDTAQVPTLHGPAGDRYAEGPGWQAAALPYVGEELDMVVIVPDAGTFDAFQAGLDAGTLDAILAGLSHAEVTLSLPKFEFRDRTPMKDTLISLGMVDAFQGGVADFSGMDGTRNLYVTDVFHEAFVAVDEAGTEAAAATAVVVGEVSAPPQRALAVDRPFLFLIRDRPTGTLLFLGRVVDPR